MDFKIDKTELKRYEKLFRDSPKLLRPVIKNVLDSLAFDARKEYIYNINRNMIVRNQRFIESSLRVDKAKSGPVNQQMAITGSIKRPRFTGWEEQQKGTQPKKNRAITKAGRGGNIKRQAIAKARLKRANKFYKPEQFAGRSRYARFLFMMRILSTRNGGEIILSKPLRIKKGILLPGLYQFKKRNLRRFQTFGINKSSKISWMSKANQQLKFSTDISKKYHESILRIQAKYIK